MVAGKVEKIKATKSKTPKTGTDRAKTQKKNRSLNPERRAFVYCFFSNLRQQQVEKGHKIVIAGDINEANRALNDSGEAILHYLSFGNIQKEGWFCPVDLGFPIQEVNSSLILDLPPH